MFKHKMLFAAFALLSSLHAGAALIDNGTYITDTATGLDWLKMGQTNFQTRGEVLPKLAPGKALSGWSYASVTQIDTLLLGQGAKSPITCFGESAFCNYDDSNPISSLGYLAVVNALQPNLQNDSPSNANWGVLLWGITGTPNAEAGDGYWTAYWIGYQDWLGVKAGYAAPHGRVTNGDWGNISSFLVRPSAVPVPAAAWLFGSGLAGLVGLARRRSK